MSFSTAVTSLSFAVKEMEMILINSKRRRIVEREKWCTGGRGNDVGAEEAREDGAEAGL